MVNVSAIDLATVTGGDLSDWINPAKWAASSWDREAEKAAFPERQQAPTGVRGEIARGVVNRLGLGRR